MLGVCFCPGVGPAVPVSGVTQLDDDSPRAGQYKDIQTPPLREGVAYSTFCHFVLG